MRFSSFLRTVLVALLLTPCSALAQIISGTVFDTDSNPVGGLVRILDAGGGHVGDFNIDPSGHFESWPLSNGSYHAVTFLTWEVLDEAWNNVPCENLLCDVTASTPIVVAGGDVTGIDFVLERIVDGARISGVVTDASDIPLAGVRLDLRNVNGDFLFVAAETGPEGQYESPMLADDSYYLHTASEPLALGRQLYDGVNCIPADLCGDPAYVVANGTPIVINSADATNIDFRLQVPAGGRIIGQLRDADFGILLPDVHLDLLNEYGQYVANTDSDGHGNYYFSGLDDGNYKVIAIWVPEGYTNEFYGGDQCPELSCDFGTNGTVITVSGGEVSSGRDIELDFVGTRILGTITRSDSGDPVSAQFGHMGVDLFNETGDYLGTWPTNRAGQFQILLPGTAQHYLRANNDWDYHGLQNELWDDIKCYNDCEPLSNGATLIEVTAGSSFVADFVLDPMLFVGGSIRFDGVLVSDGWVNLWDDQGNYVSTAGNDGTGAWRSNPLPASTYFATARGEEWGMVSQLYDGLSCPQEHCDVTSGHPLAVTDTPLTGIDFDLQVQMLQWTISGSVRDESANPLGGAVRLYDAYGYFAGQFYIDGGGNFQTHPLANGSYFLVTHETYEVLDEAWDNMPCENLLCDVTAATPVVVDGGNVSGIDFVLEPIVAGGRISGQVRDGEGTPLPGVGVLFRNIEGEYLFGMPTGPDGYYDSAFLANDAYLLHTVGEPFGLGRELFDDVKCLPGDLCFDPEFVASVGTPVVLDNSDASGIDFELEVPDGGQIIGQITDAELGIPLPDVHLDLLSEFGHYVANTDSDGHGNYYFSGLDDGNYKVLAIGVPEGYTQELYGGLQCPDLNCDLGTAGAVVTLSGGEVTGGRDIAIDFSGTRIVGTITRSDNGAPVSAQFRHMGVDLVGEAGNYMGTWPTNRAGQFQIVLPGAAHHYLTAINDWNYHGLVNEIWDDIKCVNDCDPLTNGGTLIEVLQDSTFVADFILDPELILRDGFE